jgi:hypothetical protein
VPEKVTIKAKSRGCKRVRAGYKQAHPHSHLSSMWFLHKLLRGTLRPRRGDEMSTRGSRQAPLGGGRKCLGSLLHDMGKNHIRTIYRKRITGCHMFGNCQVPP